MNINLKTVFSLLTFIILIIICSRNGQAQVTAIKAGKLVIPETGTTAINQIILIEGEKNNSGRRGNSNTSGRDHH